MKDLHFERPQIHTYEKAETFLRDMILFRKKTQKSFSVMGATATLRKVSPSLVTLILQNKRKITLDRADEFCKLMNLTSSEKLIFKNMLSGESGVNDIKNGVQPERSKNKKETSVTLLNDWLNVYVKDSFRVQSIQNNPSLLYKELGSIASKKRIDQSLRFLLAQGYLRKNENGQIVIETSLSFNETPPAGPKVRAFHKAALSIAKQNIDLFFPHERFANTLVLDLTPERYQELVSMIQEFSKALQDFSAVEKNYGDRLYQVLINLSPTGGRVE
jgi:uncharacterized protein (TIGR02147 family)